MSDSWNDKPSAWSIPKGWCKMSQKPTAVDYGTHYLVTFYYNVSQPTEAAMMMLENYGLIRFNKRDANRLGDRFVRELEGRT